MVPLLAEKRFDGASLEKKALVSAVMSSTYERRAEEVRPNLTNYTV